MGAAETLHPIQQLRRSLPALPDRLREAGRFIAEHEFDATTRSMRDLAASAGLQPATFTRLAQAIGHSGWDAFRNQLIEARRPDEPGPFTARAARRAAPDHGPAESAAIVAADMAGLAAMPVDAIPAAAAALDAAPRIWIAGFRSCRSVAVLLHYQLRLFRGDVLMVGAAGSEDADLGEFRPDDVVVVIGFAPYSRQSLLATREARAAGATLVVLADRPSSPVADGASHLLLFDADATPAFFHSLTGAVALAQALADAAFRLGGAASAGRLRRTEARLSALSQYVPDEMSR